MLLWPDELHPTGDFVGGRYARAMHYSKAAYQDEVTRLMMTALEQVAISDPAWGPGLLTWQLWSRSSVSSWRDEHRTTMTTDKGGQRGNGRGAGDRYGWRPIHSHRTWCRPEAARGPRPKRPRPSRAHDLGDAETMTRICRCSTSSFPDRLRRPEFNPVNRYSCELNQQMARMWNDVSC